MSSQFQIFYVFYVLVLPQSGLSASIKILVRSIRIFTSGCSEYISTVYSQLIGLIVMLKHCVLPFIATTCMVILSSVLRSVKYRKTSENYTDMCIYIRMYVQLLKGIVSRL